MNSRFIFESKGLIISGLRSVSDLEEYVKSVKYISDRDHNKCISKLFSLRSEDIKPNILITIRSRQDGCWGEMIGVSGESYDELRLKAAKFIRKFMISVFGEHLRSLSYENWPKFYAAFENKKSSGENCYDHIHLLVRAPDDKVNEVCDSTEYMDAWLRITQSQNFHDYDCVPLDRSYSRSCSYVHKMSGTDYGLVYSIDNRNIRSILKK